MHSCQRCMHECRPVLIGQPTALQTDHLCTAPRRTFMARVGSGSSGCPGLSTPGSTLGQAPAGFGRGNGRDDVRYSWAMNESSRACGQQLRGASPLAAANRVQGNGKTSSVGHMHGADAPRGSLRSLQAAAVPPPGSHVMNAAPPCTAGRAATTCRNSACSAGARRAWMHADAAMDGVGASDIYIYIYR